MTGGPGAEGLLLVDKPAGVTSHDVVDVVRHSLGTRKVGHAGTLDPMATGLLILGAGRATRLLRFLGDLPKTYEGTIRLGVETTTLDAEGEVVREATVSVTSDEVADAMRGLEGESLQRPPAYSAVKVGGRKLYEAARAGEELEAEPRPIRVDAFELRSYEAPDATFRVVCSGGTYVRVLAADVGAALSCGAHLGSLRRTAIGGFRVEDAAAPEDATPRSIETAVAHLPRLDLDPEEARAASHGRPLGPAGIAGPYGVFDLDGRLLGVYEDEGPRARPQVILAPA
ncbi:MAG TPA: tRNA pseudouridine(55) synthase TruB [Actinomycetota bacterium]